MGEAIRPLFEAVDGDQSRFSGVTTLLVDEHVWHHVPTKPVAAGGRVAKELARILDLPQDEHGNVHSRLLDLVRERTRLAYKNWLRAARENFTKGVVLARLHPFHGHKNVIDDEPEDGALASGAFHLASSSSPVSSMACGGQEKRT